MGDFIVVGILLLLVGAAVFYLWKEKKKGTKCIGCPSAGCCSGKTCGSTENENSFGNGKNKQ